MCPTLEWPRLYDAPIEKEGTIKLGEFLSEARAGSGAGGRPGRLAVSADTVGKGKVGAASVKLGFRVWGLGGLK
jgi:hypothetical protein